MLPSFNRIAPGLFFLLQSALSFSQTFDCSPPTFLKTWGNPNRGEGGTVLTHSSDGNLYIAGNAGNKTFLQKINFAGELIWTRVCALTPIKAVRPTQIFEDSEGMIVGCGTEELGNAGYRGLVFRYDPVADSLLWAHSIASEEPSAAGILEKTPGGNFIFYQNPNTDYDVMFIDLEIEILELDRVTGNIIPGFAKRYGYLYLDKLDKMVMANGSLYGLGSSTCRHDFGYKSNRLILARFDPTDGTPIWAQLSHIDTISNADFAAYDLAVDDDALVAAYLVSADASNWPLPIDPYQIHLQKTDLGGNILWVKKYELSTQNLQLLVVPDGYILSSTRGVTKVNKNGDFIWGRSLPPYFGTLTDPAFFGPVQAVIEEDSLYFTGQLRRGTVLNQDFDVLFWKMLADGSMSDSCGYITPFHLDAIQVQDPVSIPIALEYFPSPAVATAVHTSWSPDSMEEKILCPQYAPMSLTCPADVEVTAGQGASSVTVNFNQPDGTSDCDCPGIDKTLTDGLNSGSQFPLGTTQVCYSAQDDCGTSASCCFTVHVKADDDVPCDTKTIGCMQYDLLGITADAQQRRTYRIRVTNNCNGKLIYTAIQLPEGLVADSPDNFSTYTSPGGHDYDVRNPNYSPFYSIRFKSVGDGISNGASDVFEYTLPPQAQPAYINITSRLEPQVFYEAHLNTFNCPIGITPVQNRNQAVTIFKNSSRSVLLFPNPTNGELFADLSRWQGELLGIQILDSRGAMVQTYTLNAENHAQPVPLDTGLPAGLYFLRITTEAGEKIAERFMLDR